MPNCSQEWAQLQPGVGAIAARSGRHIRRRLETAAPLSHRCCTAPAAPFVALLHRCCTMVELTAVLSRNSTESMPTRSDAARGGARCVDTHTQRVAVCGHRHTQRHPTHTQRHGRRRSRAPPPRRRAPVPLESSRATGVPPGPAPPSAGPPGVYRADRRRGGDSDADSDADSAADSAADSDPPGT